MSFFFIVRTVLCKNVTVCFNSNRALESEQCFTCVLSKGDAGGPLAVQQGDDWIMAGIVIRGPKQCGAADRPTVYWRHGKKFITSAIEGMFMF